MTIELTKEEIQAIYNLICYASCYISSKDETLIPGLTRKFYDITKKNETLFKM